MLLQQLSKIYQIINHYKFIINQYMDLPMLFPELAHYHQNPLDAYDLQELSYFQRFSTLLHDRQWRGRGQKVKDLFQLIKIKRGTVIYLPEQIADKGYIILNGCVQLLNKKNARQKLQNFPGHYASSNLDKINYLNSKYKIPKDKAEYLINEFYEDKIEFNFLPAFKLYAQNEFGFGEMIRNTMRTQVAIAIQNCEILVIEKQHFDTHLRDFQSKKQISLISKMMKFCPKEITEDVSAKMHQIMNNSYLLKYEKQDILYEDGDYPSHLYFVIEGEVELRKKINLEVPKKYLRDENRGKLEREVTVKISKLGQNSFVGQAQILFSKKHRQFTVAVTANDSLILKIDHTSFLKVAIQFTHFENKLIQQADMKRKHTSKKYEKELNKITKAFLGQYEDFDNKRKQKMLSNFINSEDHQNDMFEVYAPEGVFYRDTFEKLEGYDQNKKQMAKISSIKRFKVKNGLSSPEIKNTGMDSPLLSKSPSKKIDETQKKLFSPKKSMNPIDFILEKSIEEEKNSKQNLELSPKEIEDNSEDKTSMKEESRLKSLKKQYRSLGKFQQIQKDEDVFKRVMIKHGMFPVDRNIDKSKAVKPLIHRNFDDVVKQCISRKNNIIKRVDKHQQNDIMMETFHRTLSSLKNQAGSTTMKFSRFTTPCKGTEEMKKRMQSIQNTPSRMSDHTKLHSYKNSQHKIEDCIGINQKPRSSQHFKKNNGSSIMSNRGNIPEKIVLLNHMMKPITYYNFNSTDI